MFEFDLIGVTLGQIDHEGKRLTFGSNSFDNIIIDNNGWLKHHLKATGYELIQNM